jgi:predicted permease
MWTHVRITLRQCVRRPGFAAAVLATMTLAIAANVTMFSVVNAVLLRELPFTDPGRLVWVASVRADTSDAPFSLPEYLDYRRQTRTLMGLAAYANWSASVAEEDGTERLQGARMSANAFDLLGMQPSAGRLLRESDDSGDAPPVAVVSYRLWQRRLGGADVTGRTLRINGESYAVVGVMPRHFPFPLRDVDVVVPLAPDRDPLRYSRSSVNFLRLFGRLAPGSAADMAAVELTSICRVLRQQFPREYARKERVRLAPLHDVIVGDYKSMMTLLVTVLVVLATALGNLISLALVRANERRTELAVRIALGASRRQVFAQLMSEALALMLIAGAAGLMLAGWTINAIVPWIPASIPRLDEVSIDLRGVLFAGALTAVAALVIGVAPFVTMVQTRAGDALRGAGRGTIGHRLNQRIRDILVGGEVAVALLLLVGSAALLRNVWALERVHLGFLPEGVFQARVAVPSTYRSPDDLTRFYERLAGRLSASPGVQRVGVISIAPLSGLLATVEFGVDARPSGQRDAPTANLRVVTPGYFSAVGTRIVDGRGPSEADRSTTPAIAVVNQTLARKFFPTGALRHRLFIDDNNDGARPVEIVGVVEDVRQSALDVPVGFDVYIALPQMHPDGVPILRNNQFWMVSTNLNPDALRAPFIGELRAVDPDAAVASAGAMRQYLDAWLGPRRFNLRLFAGFSFMALALATFGIYALVSYTVSQRRADIGLRIALGAARRDVYRLIMRDVLRVSVGGAVAGVMLIAAARPLAARVAASGAVDFALTGAMMMLVLAVAATAAWAPARRALRIDPSITLRPE